MLSHLRRYFISGLLVLLPIWVTVLLLGFFTGILDSTLSLLPLEWQPDTILGFHLPGLGAIVIFVVILVTGMLVTNILGRRLVALWDHIIGHIPIVRSIYNAVKQVADTLLSSQGQSFRKVFLVEYPRKGMWSLGFQTGTGCEEVVRHVGGGDLITLFIPTTPNPTSGYLMMVPLVEAIELKMSVEDGLKFVISLGVVQASNRLKKKPTNVIE